MARAIAERLGVPVKYVPFPKPGELADEAGKDVWDIGLIGAEPARAEKIAFTAAYAEIEATYLVPAGLAAEDDRRCGQAGRADRGDRARRRTICGWSGTSSRRRWCGRTAWMRAFDQFVARSWRRWQGCGRGC